MPLYLQPKSEGESAKMTLARFWLTLDMNKKVTIIKQ